jgi:small subunit ribosomal protein S6
MSRTKSSEIPHYELLYIIPNRFTEDEVGPITSKVNKLIEDNGGKVTYQEEWGKKKLAYKIKDSVFGYYYLVEFDLPGSELEKVDKSLRMDREILRYQIVSKKLKTDAEIKEEKKRSESRIKEEVKKEEVAIEKEKEKERSKTKMDLKDLDEKLDKILDTDDLL